VGRRGASCRDSRRRKREELHSKSLHSRSQTSLPTTIPFDSLTTPFQQQHYGRRQANDQAGTCATRDSDNQDETREESPCGGMTLPSALRSPVTLGKKRGTAPPRGGGVFPALFRGAALIDSPSNSYVYQRSTHTLSHTHPRLVFPAIPTNSSPLSLRFFLFL
jgi:hypothetical protein